MASSEKPPKTVSYGRWESPISADAFAAGSVELDQVVVDTIRGKTYLLESRPAEEGRNVIVQITEDGIRDVLPKDNNAATHVHEYGGAAFTVRQSDGKIVFADGKTNLVFLLDPETGETEAIVEHNESIYFADFDTHPIQSDWVIAIKEDHSNAKTIQDVKNTLVAINVPLRTIQTIATSADFYTYPRFSPDGKHVCWVQWNHPDMPWTGTELYIAPWTGIAVGEKVHIAGQLGKVSVRQPRWSLDGSLFFVGDQTGYPQIYRYQGVETKHIRVKGYEDAEFTGPEWWLGSSTYVPLTVNLLVAAANRGGQRSLLFIDPNSGDHTNPGYEINELEFKALQRVSDNSFVVIGATSISLKSLYLCQTSDKPETRVLKASTELGLDSAYLSPAQPITYPRKQGPGGGEAYGLFYPPKNPSFEAPSDELPPLIINMHGGPTWQWGPGLSLEDQYWSSRGYAVAKVNYAGSTGYGRKFVHLLDAQWGVSDIADAVNCIDYLAQKKLVDGKRVGITGGSAGGYATLMALCEYPDIFAAGVSLYGISEMALMVAETHKFESEYLNALCFPPGTSEAEKEKIMKERSPLYHVDKIKAPLLLLQGLEDKVVPPNQAERIKEVIQGNGGDVKAIFYEGEGHVFHNGVNVKDSFLQAERWWQRTLLK